MPPQLQVNALLAMTIITKIQKAFAQLVSKPTAELALIYLVPSASKNTQLQLSQAQLILIVMVSYKIYSQSKYTLNYSVFSIIN